MPATGSSAPSKRAKPADNSGLIHKRNRRTLGGAPVFWAKIKIYIHTSHELNIYPLFFFTILLYNISNRFKLSFSFFLSSFSCCKTAACSRGFCFLRPVAADKTGSAVYQTRYPGIARIKPAASGHPTPEVTGFDHILRTHNFSLPCTDLRHPAHGQAADRPDGAVGVCGDFTMPFVSFGSSSWSHTATL